MPCQHPRSREAARVDGIRGMTDNSLDPGNEEVDIDGSGHELHREIEALRASRAHMIVAADDERRRIERELHDGVQQHLVALAVNVQLAQQLADSDVAAAKALLEEIGRDVREALDGVRELANEIYPPLLIDRGLAEALRAMSSTAAIATHVEVGALERHPTSVEATVYFCCLEALRSAAGTRATVRAWQTNSALYFEVLDDGPDSGHESRELAAAAERVEALGGALTVSGRHVSGTIPVSP